MHLGPDVELALPRPEGQGRRGHRGELRDHAPARSGLILARFFDEDRFEARFEQELALAEEVEQRVRSRAPDFATRVFDVTFVSNAQPKLSTLVKQLTGMGYRFDRPVKANRLFEVSGQSMPLPVSEDAVVYWAIDLYCRGFEHDCIFEAYGALSDFEPTDMTKSAETYFDRALEAYERGNRGLAIAEFNIAIALEPDNPNTWYSRACVKDQIYVWKAARDDYDKAIELAPTFVSALVNRGANKDANDEHAEAIADYDKAIAVNPEASAAFLNRGNSKFALGDKLGAIADWKVAASLGDDTARERLADHE